MVLASTDVIVARAGEVGSSTFAIRGRIQRRTDGPGPLQPGRFTQFKVSSPSGPQPEVWFSRVVRHQFGFQVMLFADPRDGR